MTKIRKKLTRTAAILIATVMLCAMTASCARKQELPEHLTDVNAGPVRVLIDLEVSDQHISKKVVENFKEEIKELGGPEDVEVEYAPAYGPDRKSVLTELRTELLAGKGPDVFITTSGIGNIKHTSSSDDYKGYHEDALFKFPQAAMENRTFLPLDDYLENAQFMEWDKYTQVIMEAGRNERGQMILPMSYTLPVTLFHQEDYWPDPSRTATFDEMVSGDSYARLAATHNCIYQTLVFRDLIDFEKDMLAITEDEYLDYVRTWVELNTESENITHLEAHLSRYTINAMNNEIERARLGKTRPVSFVPLYCKEGGYGAAICNFGAINANTKNPAGAFFILDYLMSPMAPGLVSLYSENYSIPTYEDGITRERVGDIACVSVENQEGYWAMSYYHYPELVKIRDNISWARFRTPIEAEFWNPGLTYLYDETNTKSLETLVHENYVFMNMILGES